MLAVSHICCPCGCLLGACLLQPCMAAPNQGASQAAHFLIMPLILVCPHTVLHATHTDRLTCGIRANTLYERVTNQSEVLEVVVENLTDMPHFIHVHGHTWIVLGSKFTREAQWQGDWKGVGACPDGEPAIHADEAWLTALNNTVGAAGSVELDYYCGGTDARCGDTVNAAARLSVCIFCCCGWDMEGGPGCGCRGRGCSVFE